MILILSKKIHRELHNIPKEIKVNMPAKVAQVMNLTLVSVAKPNQLFGLYSFKRNDSIVFVIGCAKQNLTLISKSPQ